MHFPRLMLLLAPLATLVAPARSAEPVVETGPPLRVENAWVREAPPGADVLAAYALFCNDADKAVTLASATSEDFDGVEMHATIETESAVTMERLNNVVVGPNDCVAFAPGGRHFMLLGPNRALRSGDEVEFTLRFANGREMEVVMPVRRADEAPGDEHAAHHGHH